MSQPREALFQGQPPSYSRPPYNPPQYLLSSTGLSRDEFVSQYQGLTSIPVENHPSLTASAFIQSLQHVEIAPELVFERMVGNVRTACTPYRSISHSLKHVVQLKEVFNTALIQQHAFHASALEDWRREKIALEADLARATATAKKAEKGTTATP